MSARRNFLRNITMAIAASLVPRILQPAVPELPEPEELVPVQLNTFVYAPAGYEHLGESTFYIPKSDYDILIKFSWEVQTETESAIIWQQTL
jgi:hypothetical protein